MLRRLQALGAVAVVRFRFQVWRRACQCLPTLRVCQAGWYLLVCSNLVRTGDLAAGRVLAQVVSVLRKVNLKAEWGGWTVEILVGGTEDLKVADDTVGR